MSLFTPENPAHVLAIMPHPDDFDFNIGGTFALLKKHYGDAVNLKVITTSTGVSGHHQMTALETITRRLSEAKASAALIGAEAEFLTQLDGTHICSQVIVDRNLLGGVWNAIRNFRADFVFCPPLSTDPLSGIHIDHEETARAVRSVAYQLNVPRAYPTLSGNANFTYRTPAIILADDVYSLERHFDFACDITTVYPTKVAMAECHASQVFEWGPFLKKEEPPSRDEFHRRFRNRHTLANARFELPDDVPREFFRLSQWGRSARRDELEWLFPCGVSK